MDSTPFRDTNETASLLRVTPPTIRLWYRQGLLRGFRIRRRLLFRQSDIDRLVGAQLEPNRGEAA